MAYSSGSGMTWLLTITRMEPLEFAAKLGDVDELLKVPAKKSPMGLLRMPAPVQAEDAPLEKDKVLETRNPILSPPL